MKNINSNNKKIKHVLCYIGLVVLTILLFLPLVFKIAYKDRKKENSSVVVWVLNCNIGNEVIRSTFKNDDPQIVTYTIPGNHTSQDTTQEGTSEIVNETIVNDDFNPIIKKFSNYSTFTYNEQDNNSSMKFNVEVVKGTIDYESIFASIDLQENYFKSQGFTCTREKY